MVAVSVHQIAPLMETVSIVGMESYIWVKHVMMGMMRLLMAVALLVRSKMPSTVTPLIPPLSAHPPPPFQSVKFKFLLLFKELKSLLNSHQKSKCQVTLV